MSDDTTPTKDANEAAPDETPQHNDANHHVEADWQVIWSPDGVLSAVFSLTPKDRRNTTISSITVTFSAATREGVITQSFAGAEVRASTKVDEGQEMAGNLGFDAAPVRDYDFGKDQVLQAVLAGLLMVRGDEPRNFFFTKTVPMPILPLQPPEEEAADGDDGSDDDS